MFELKVRQTFAGAHYLRNYKGKCENLHGHNWTVWLHVTGSELDDAGMLVDFKLLKQALQSALSGLDHQNLNELPEFRTENPSAEHLARFVYGHCERVLAPFVKGVRVQSVEVQETENACATYFGASRSAPLS